MWLVGTLPDSTVQKQSCYIRLFYSPVPLLILFLHLGCPSLPFYSQTHLAKYGSLQEGGGGKESCTLGFMVNPLFLVFFCIFIHLHYFLLGTGDAKKNPVLAIELKVNPFSGITDYPSLPINQVISHPTDLSPDNPSLSGFSLSQPTILPLTADL